MTSDRKIKATVQHAIQFDGSKYVSGQSIQCSHEGCSETERITTNNFSHRLPDDVLAKKFKQRGWVFRSGEWLCPAHGRARKAPQRPVVTPEPVLALVVPMIQPQPVATGLDLIRELPEPAICERALRGEPHCAINSDINPFGAPVGSEHGVCKTCFERAPEFFKGLVRELPEPPPPLPKETTTMVEAATPLRSFGDLANAAIDKMGTSDRRRILREIMDNWDESHGRYIGAVADQSIASKLNVPRAWVQHLRVENVGDNGQNEEIEDLRADLEKALRNFDVAADDAMKIAVRIDALAKSIRELLARVERVEKATGVRR